MHMTFIVQHLLPGEAPGRMVGWLGFSGPFRQYFSLYQAVSQREGEKGEKGQRRVKMSKQPPPAPTASAIGPCPTIIQSVGRPGTGSLSRTIAFKWLDLLDCDAEVHGFESGLGLLVPGKLSLSLCSSKCLPFSDQGKVI